METIPRPPGYEVTREAPPRKSLGLLISTIALGGLLVVGVITGTFVVTGLQGDLDETRDQLSVTQVNLGDAEATNIELQADLDSADAKATACAKAADLLAVGANGYAKLWNQIDRAADRWRYVFDFYLYGVLSGNSEVPNSTLRAGWDALDECEAGGSSVELA